MTGQQTYILLVLICHLAVTLKFKQQMYTINESDGLVKPMLILSDPLTTNLFLQVMTVDSLATSKWQIATLQECL